MTVPSISLTVWLPSGKYVCNGPRSESTRVENFFLRICRQPQKWILAWLFVLIRHRFGRRRVAREAVSPFVATEFDPELIPRTYTYWWVTASYISACRDYRCQIRWVRSSTSTLETRKGYLLKSLRYPPLSWLSTHFSYTSCASLAISSPLLSSKFCFPGLRVRS